MNKSMNRLTGIIPLVAPLLTILAYALVVLGGCSTIVRRPVPESLVDSVHVAAMPENIRSWGDRYHKAFHQNLSESIVQAERTYGREDPPAILSISSGGVFGAYGAGVLCGWTAQGNRPKFRIVTGVSVGAIIAPFAFLGSEFDDRLAEMARSTPQKSIFVVRLWPPGLMGDSIADNTPLARLVSRYFDQNVLNAIAAEHANGRRLFIATTNLDANRPVIWDMGAIACSRSPGALHLFHKVIVASAAVPVVFPPTYIEVEHDGRRYDEMHVDGAVAAQFLLYGRSVAVEEVLPNPSATRPRGTHFVISNRKFSTAWDPVEPSIRAIATHSINQMMQDQGVGDLWQLYAACRRDNLDFRLASIPDDEELPFEGLDVQAAARLFDRGYADARAGYRWANEPPGLRVAPRVGQAPYSLSDVRVAVTASGQMTGDATCRGR